MQVAVSGLDEASCRALVGEVAWAQLSLTWIDPGDFLQCLAGQRPEPRYSSAVWLYRSPALVAIEAAAAGLEDVQALLCRWLSVNRTVLSFHRQHGMPFRLLNIDGTDVEGFPVQVFGSGERDDSDSGPSKGRDASSGAIEELLYWLFEQVAPQYVGLFESLEASSWLPRGREPIFRNVNKTIDTVGFSEILDVVLSKPRARPRLVDLEGRIARSDTALSDAREEGAGILQENRLLLIQLHQLQTEIRKSEEDNARLAELANSRDHAHMAAKEEIDLLKVQLNDLRLMSAALRVQFRLHLAPLIDDEPNGVLQRLARRFSGAAGHQAQRFERRSRVADIRESAWFDSEWYLRTNEDVRSAGADPVEHYYDVGWTEGRDPSARFDTMYYLRSYADVALSGLNPLWHFVMFGEKEGRLPRAS